MVTIDRERLKSEKQNNKASPEGARLPKEAMLLRDRNFKLRYSKRLESIRVLGTDRKSVMMIKVKVNSNSKFLEDREGKSTLYGAICCCDGSLLSRAVICGHTV